MIAHPPRFTNSLGMTMVRIEPGEFLMGSSKAQIDALLKQFPDAKREWFDGEQPQHPVKIARPFYLAAHHVTVGQFRRFVVSILYQTDDEKTGKGSLGRIGKEWKQEERFNWRTPGFEQGENHPVVCVSHNDAVAFVAWLNKQDRSGTRTYQLPTEAEWEYACRAGASGVCGLGDDPGELDRFAWFVDNLNGATRPVGRKGENAFGLYDMIGNAGEWCDDWYDPQFYQSSPKDAPRNVEIWETPLRVIRGGFWFCSASFCRPAFRIGNPPDIGCFHQGFRVAAVQG
jgi:formylglycine-generating enzyme required for sulfatase activity